MLTESLKTILFYLFLNLTPLSVGLIVYYLTKHKAFSIKISHPTLLIWILLLVFTIFIASLAILHVEALNSHCDTGFTLNFIWYTAHGSPYATSMTNDGNYLAVHVTAIPLILSFFNLIMPGYPSIPIVQVFVIALGGLAIYQIFRKLIGINTGVFFAVIYWLSPFVGWMCLNEYNEATYILTTTLFTLVAILKRREKLFWVLFTILIVIREDAAIMGSMLGLYLFFFHKQRLQGAIAFLIGLAVCLIDIQLIIPIFHHSQSKQITSRFQGLGNSFSDVLLSPFLKPDNFLSVALNPDKLLYFIQLFLNFAYLPFLAWDGWILMVPFIYETLLTTYAPQYSIYSMYHGYLLPGVILGTAMGFSRLVKWQKKRNPLKVKTLKYGLGGFLISISLLMGYWFGPLPLSWNKNFHPSDYIPTKRTTIARQMISLIPADASIYGSDNLTPFFADRSNVYTRTYTEPGDCLADFVIFDDRFDLEHGFESAPANDQIRSLYDFIYINEELYLGIRKNLQSVSKIQPE